MPKTRPASIATRASLLRRMKNWEDQDSWRDFFDAYWRLIYSVAVKAGLTDAEAQDVVQDTVITVARKIQSFDYDPARGSFKAWLCQITRWRIADQYRKRLPASPRAGRPAEDSRRTATLERIADPAAPDLDTLWETEWHQHVLHTALERVRRRVSEKQYAIFDLYVSQAKPVAAVMRELGVSRGQVYLAKLRVGNALRQEVKRLAARLDRGASAP